MEWAEIFHVAALVRRTPVVPAAPVASVAAVRNEILTYCKHLEGKTIKSLTKGKDEPADPPGFP